MKWSMLVFFICAFIFNLPIIYMYRQGGAYNRNLSSKNGPEVNSLGNWGYSEVLCELDNLNTGTISMTCPWGVIGEIYDFGVNNVVGAGVDGLICQSTDANMACKPTNQAIIDLLFGSVGQNGFST
jgi:hypothetical protein